MELAQIFELALEILAFIGGSAVLSALIPTKYKKWLPAASTILEVVAMNIGNARNEENVN